MNYPSTTQALFALIVMVIVLLFILVYCCWGTLTCARQDEAAAPTSEDATGPNSQHDVRHILRGPHTVIVPINNMIYVGDPETHQIYQIPLDRDKPPAYTEIFRAGPPPPYRPDTELSSTTTLRQQDSRSTLPESPPAYDECLTVTSEESVAEQGNSYGASGLTLAPQQEAAAVSPVTPPVSNSTLSAGSVTPGTNQGAQDSSLSSTQVVLAVSSLAEATQPSPQQSAEAGPSHALPTALHI